MYEIVRKITQKKRIENIPIIQKKKKICKKKNDFLKFKYLLVEVRSSTFQKRILPLSLPIKSSLLALEGKENGRKQNGNDRWWTI